MTKATTQGEKRRRKRGRPSVTALTNPDGSRRRKSRAGESKSFFRDDDPRDLVARRRCAEAGLKPDYANRKKVMGSNYGSELGKLVEAKLIAQPLANAGFAYAELEARYACIMGLPPRHAKVASYAEIFGAEDGNSPEAIVAVRRRHAAMQTVLRKIGVVPLRLLVSVCLDDEPLPKGDRPIAALALGLTFLAEHFGEAEREAA